MKKIVILLLGIIFFANLQGQYYIEESTGDTIWDASYYKSSAPKSGSTILNVPYFSQTDPRWADNTLGTCDGSTIGSEGCVVTDMAMLLAANGCNVDPGALNSWLINNNGYANGCLLKWYVATNYPGSQMHYVNSFTYNLNIIKSEIDEGDPVIVLVSNNPTHFVVVYGYTGSGTSPSDFLVHDPYDNSITNLGNASYSPMSLRVFDDVSNPLVPQVLTPYDEQVNVSIPVNISFSLPEGYNRVRVNVSDSPEGFDPNATPMFPNPVLDVVLNNPTTSYEWTDAQPGHTYYMAVRVNVPNVGYATTRVIKFTTEGSGGNNANLIFDKIIVNENNYRHFCQFDAHHCGGIACLPTAYMIARGIAHPDKPVSADALDEIMIGMKVYDPKKDICRYGYIENAAEYAIQDIGEGQPENGFFESTSSDYGSDEGRTTVKEELRSWIAMGKPVIVLVSVSGDQLTTTGGIGHFVVLVGLKLTDIGVGSKAYYIDPMDSTPQIHEVDYTLLLNSCRSASSKNYYNILKIY